MISGVTCDDGICGDAVVPCSGNPTELVKIHQECGRLERRMHSWRITESQGHFSWYFYSEPDRKSP